MIIYFSGTGNTRFVAHELARLLGDSHIVCLDEELLRNPEESELKVLDSDRHVVWAFPTYGWGIPPVVENFIRNFQCETTFATLPHFMLTTCGDDIGRTDRQWRRLMAQRCFRAEQAFSVQMPNTFVFMPGFDVDSQSLTRKKLEAAPSAIGKIADMISGCIPARDLITPGMLPWLKSGLFKSFFWNVYMKSTRFRHTGACVGCGECSRSCPMGNIVMTRNSDGHREPSWGSACAYCLRCYHICPNHAVDYLHTTRSKGRYIAPDTEQLKNKN